MSNILRTNLRELELNCSLCSIRLDKVQSNRVSLVKNDHEGLNKRHMDYNQNRLSYYTNNQGTVVPDDQVCRVCINNIRFNRSPKRKCLSRSSTFGEESSQAALESYLNDTSLNEESNVAENSFHENSVNHEREVEQNSIVKNMIV